MHAALSESFLDHGVHVHERLDIDALDALGHELSKATPVAKHCLPREAHERAEAQIACLTHVAEEARN
jgi:hypothetical protein